VSEVHRASASLQQLQRELLSSNKAIASSTKLANNLFRDTLTGSGQFSSHFVNLNSDVDKFGKNLDAGRLKLRSYFSTFREHATTQKGMIRELAKEQVMLQNAVLQPLGRNAQGLMQYNVMIPRGLDAVKNGTQLARMEMQIMNRALSEGAGSLINWGKNTQWAGRQLTVGLTVPLTMFGAAAGKAFREADQELVRLTKVYGGLAATSSSDLKAIREEVVRTAKSLSQTMGASFKDTIALGADIAATGQMGNELLGSIEETTRLAILGEVDRQDAMKATLSIQTAFKQNTEELTESINFLNAVENQTSTTLNDLVEAIPKAGPVVQQLGGSIEDLALYMTAMKEGGINASEGANALKSGLASLINPTKQTVGMMSDFGIDVMGMVAKNTGNTTGLLMDLQKSLDALDPLSKARALEQMFGKFQFARMSALLNNLGKEGSQTLQVMELMKASTSDLAGIAERELGMITESASGKYKRAMESLKASLADIGEDFLPVATKLINAASKILDFFSNLPAPIKKAVTFLAGFTALVGPLIMLTGVLANFFGYITKGIVQLRAFFMKANGWKMLTPEIIAAQKAAEMVETAFYSDAAAAQVLHNALQKLVLDYQNLQAASMKGAVPVNPGLVTTGGAAVLAPGRRVVDPTDPYVGDVNTRAMSHINPRDPNNPATIFGGVPGAVPVNRGISRTPQMYMHDRLPNVEGLTSVRGISTGIVPGEAAKHHALMATLGMQSQEEIAALKKTIAMGGTVSRELLDTFDDILPITQRFADSAATQSAAIVQQMRNAEITVEQAKARILALNAQIEADMGAAVSAYAASRGRRIDLTRAPMMDQPVVDANGQFTLRDLYKKKANASVMEEFGRLRGVRTFGAPYSIQTTRPPRFNTGGSIESFGPSKTMVSGSSSINYDDRLGSVPVGGYVLNQQASMDPANAALVAMAPSTYLNNGGNITAALTPREVVFGPQIQRMPELYAAVDAANSGYNFGGQIMNGVTGYGRQTSKTPQVEDKAYYKKRLKEYLRFINNPRYEDDIRLRMIMLDAAELVGRAKMPMSKAIGIATSNFDLAKSRSGGSLERFIDLRVKQVQGLERKFPELKLANSSDTRTGGGSKSLNYELNNVRSAMLADRRFKNVWDLIEAVSPTDIKNSKGMPLLEGLHARGHIKRHGTVGYGTRGHMGVAAIIPSGINSIMARLQDIGISPDVLNLSGPDARKNFELALKSVGMHRMTTVDDIATALEDNNLFKSKAEIKAGNTVRATSKQRNDLQMFLEAVMSRKKWVMIPRGRPPMMTPVLARLNKGGMIPGGSVSRDRSSYGNVAPLLRLLTPTQQLKVLQHARSMSFTGRSVYPETSYSHLLSPTTGRSFPVPGVGGVYDDQQKNRVFFKAVPNEVSLIAETRGTEIGRILGLTTPVQTRKTIRNPLDPSGKSKFLGAESPYDEGFINPNTAVAGKFTQDEVLDQLIASMIFANKDLSRSNIHGRRLADVGNAGVLAKASMNSDFADKLPSMEEMAMINLLQVRGGARKDFAHDTAPIVAQMTPKQYGAAIKKKMEAAYPELRSYVYSIPRKERKPYLAMLKRFEEGMDVNWAKYQPMHANPKYHAGGPIGPIPLGGPIKKGRSAYGRKGNPAARAEQERIKAERAASYRGSGGSSYTATGNPQMQVSRVPYVGGTGVRGNAYTASFTPNASATINALRFGNLIPSPINSALDSLTASIKVGSEKLRAGLQTSGARLAQAYRASTTLIVNTGKASLASTKRFATSAAEWARGAASSTRNSILMQQAAVTARHYPNGGFDPYQRSYFGPGMVGNWQGTGQDGIQKRKVGSLGFRKTEFMVDGQNMTRAQAKAAGVALPARGPMGMGTSMGIGMAGSMGGMALMSQEKVKVGGMEMSGMSAGMGVMAASSILPFLPYAKMGAGLKTAGTASLGLAKGMKAAWQAGTFLSKILPKLLHFAKVLGPIGAVITIASTAFALFKANNDANQDATMGLSMTAKAAEQAGVKYFNLQETMQGYIDKQTAILAVGKASRFSSIGMPGLPQSIEDMKKAKEEGKGLKDLIESINRSTTTAETKRLVTNQKAQYIAAGMSVAEANRKIYGALLNSEKSSQVFDIIGNSLFGSIIDKSSAAEYAVSNLINTLNKGAGTADWAKEVGNGFEGLINVFSSATNSLIGTKDELGNVIDEYAAWQMVMGDAEKSNPKINQAIGDDTYQNLIKTQPLLELIANKSDTIKGILSKWKLFTSGIAIDLSAIDSEMANKLAGFTQAIGTGITQLTKAAGGDTTFSAVGSALERLKKTIGSVSAASQRSAAAAQRSANEELKLISKKIKLIDDEKNKKLEALRATQDASNYALELQKLQIEYADAVSRGDMARANRAQLDIDQLTLNRQSELAQKAIEDAANKAKAPLEKKAAAIQETSDKKSNILAGQQDAAAAASEMAAKLTDFQERYNEIVERGIQAQVLPDAERKKEEKAVRESLLAFAKEVQTAGTGSSALSKEIRNAFFKLGLFDKNGKPIPVTTTTPTGGMPTGFDKNGKAIVPTTTTVNTALTDQFAKDMKAVTTLALDITGGTTIYKLRMDLLEALGKSGTASLADPSKVKGTFTPATDSKPATYRNAAGEVITKDQYENLPGGTSAPYKNYSIPLEGVNDKLFQTWNELITAFKAANGGKGLWSSPDGLEYDTAGMVRKNKKILGRWYGYTSKNKPKTYNQGSPGGVVYGPGTATSDSIPALLSNGEYVVRASAVKQYGVEHFDALNAQKFSTGGVAAAVRKDPTLRGITSPFGTRQRMLDTATSQLGISEEGVDPKTGEGNNITKYSRWINKLEGLGTDVVTWCGTFIQWVAAMSDVKIPDTFHTAGGARSFAGLKQLVNSGMDLPTAKDKFSYSVPYPKMADFKVSQSRNENEYGKLIGSQKNIKAYEAAYAKWEKEIAIPEDVARYKKLEKISDIGWANVLKNPPMPGDILYLNWAMNPKHQYTTEEEVPNRIRHAALATKISAIKDINGVPGYWIDTIDGNSEDSVQRNNYELTRANMRYNPFVAYARPNYKPSKSGMLSDIIASLFNRNENDTYTVKRDKTLPEIARSLKIDYDDLAKLNPEYLRGNTVYAGTEINIPKAKPPVKKARGGPVFGAGTATSDSIPALLSNGEYVIKADSVKKYGTGVMDHLNAGRFAEGGLIQKPGLLFNDHDPKPAVDYTPLPSTPISKLGKSTQAQIKYLTDWNNLLNTYYAAKYQNIFAFKPGEKISTGLNTMPVVKGTKVVKDPDKILLDTEQYGAYYSLDRSDITMGLGLAGRPAFIPNPIQDPVTMKNLNQKSSFPFLSKGMSPVDYIESISKDAQKNPYARMEILTTLFHEFAHALQFRINGYIKSSQASRALTDVGDPNKPTPGFLNIESGADVMAGGIFKEMYSNGYIPQIKKSIIDTLLKSKILTASYGDIPAFNTADPASEGFTWHPSNANFRFKSVMTGMAMGDSAAFDDTISLYRNRSTGKLFPTQEEYDNRDKTPITFAEIGNTAAAIAAITPNMIPKGFSKGGKVKKPIRTGMGIDKDPMRYAGSGASMGGIGNGVYGLGPLMFHKGGPVGHRHGRFHVRKTEKQLAQENKNLSYYESKIDEPIKSYSEGFAKIFTKTPFGFTSPLVALAADLIDVYFKGQKPSFGGNGIADLDPASYESHVSGIMQALIHPFAEIAKGSATKGDWVNAGLNLIPGVGLAGKANAARAAAGAAKVVDKATAGMTAEQRVALVPNATLRQKFVDIKKAGDIGTEEFRQARYELALSDALIAAKKNNFTSLPALKDSSFPKLLAENQNLPAMIEEAIKIRGREFIFRFKKGNISPNDKVPVENFLQGLREGKVQAKSFGNSTMHQIEILDPTTKAQAAFINYDPVTGYIHYRGTAEGYRDMGLSDALYNKAVSITRIRHSDNLSDMGRPSALRIGGFMADDPYYGAIVPPTGLKQYLDAFMKFATSKKPKPSTGEAPLPGGIGNPLGFRPVTPADSGAGGITLQSELPGARFPYNKFNDRNSIIGQQQDRLTWFNNELRESLREETIHWYESMGRTSANFPYGPGGYVEPGALPELQRIVDLENAYRSGKVWGDIPEHIRSAVVAHRLWYPGRYAKGGLVQNFSNSALGNLGIPMFENGINMVPANMLAMLHKNEAVVPANMNPFNPNATSSAIASGSVYNINVELNGTTVTAQDVAAAIHKEMRVKEMVSGVNRRVNG
jgi:TP901 family phage tail tape measure protein